MASLVEIANSALAELGADTISTLDDAKTSARVCKAHIFDSIREVLAVAPWKCARTQAVLAQVIPAPTFAWTYGYQLPPDFISLVSFNEQTMDTCARMQYLFEIQGTILLTNESFCKIVYVKDLTINQGDVNSMPPLITRACVLNLAATISFPLMQSTTLKQELQRQFDQVIRKAAARDTVGSFSPTIPANSGSNWFRSIYGSTNG